MDFNWGLIGPGRIAEKFAGAMKAEGVGKHLLVEKPLTVATSQWFMQADPDDIVSQVHIGPTGVDETLANQRIMDQVRQDAGLVQ